MNNDQDLLDFLKSVDLTSVNKINITCYYCILDKTKCIKTNKNVCKNCIKKNRVCIYDERAKRYNIKKYPINLTSEQLNPIYRKYI